MLSGAGYEPNETDDGEPINPRKEINPRKDMSQNPWTFIAHLFALGQTYE
jgi:hypothetical protein